MNYFTKRSAFCGLSSFWTLLFLLVFRLFCGCPSCSHMHWRVLFLVLSFEWLGLIRLESVSSSRKQSCHATILRDRNINGSDSLFVLIFIRTSTWNLCNSSREWFHYSPIIRYFLLLAMPQNEMSSGTGLRADEQTTQTTEWVSWLKLKGKWQQRHQDVLALSRWPHHWQILYAITPEWIPQYQYKPERGYSRSTLGCFTSASLLHAILFPTGNGESCEDISLGVWIRHAYFASKAHPCHHENNLQSST